MTKDTIPTNVANPTLYRSVRNRMRKAHSRKSKRWSAYSSGQLVQEYKRKGGRYKNPTGTDKSRPKSGKLSRWYREKWVDACAYIRGQIKECGRKSIESGKFPYCRPLHRITKSTPHTVKELSRSELKRLCSLKRRSVKKSKVKKRSVKKSKVKKRSVKKSKVKKRSVKKSKVKKR